MYKVIVGLEAHVELNTKSKMFCSCLNDSNERHPNVNICPVCTAQPGTLPVINKEAARKTIKTGLALNCQIPEYSKFDRKNYFYPDLPKNSQISQLYQPLCKNGFLEIISFQENSRKIRIREVHLEEDVGRLIHEKDCSLVDFYLPDYKVAIYVDGDYWHNLPVVKNRDEKQNRILEENGYQVLRFWEHEIKRSVGECVNKIKEYVKF